MTALSNRKFVANTVADGGASRFLKSREAPTQGVAVGGAADKHGARIPERTVQLSEFSTGHAEAHLRHLRNITDRSDPSIAQGSWVHPTKGHVVLDASNIYQSRGRAKLEGLKRGEEALYDIGKGEDIRVPRRAVGGKNLDKGDRLDKPGITR